MLLKSFRVQNFKAFSDTGSISVSEDTTVFVGRNNSGKSALFEALKFTRLSNKPFRRNAADRGSGKSKVEATVLISGADMLDALRTRRGAERISIPIDSSGMSHPQKFIDDFFSKEKIEFTIARTGDGQISAVTQPSHKLFAQQAIARHILININDDGSPVYDPNSVYSINDTIPRILAPYFDDSLFLFSAQRTVGSSERFAKTDGLDPVGANLPNALNTLQGTDPRKFQKFKNYVQAILPDLTNISVEPAREDLVDIRVWSEGAGQNAGELSVSLAECGTGVGQVLAIVYAAMSEKPSIIAIDEPNSFLHPGATKQLINILSEMKNQYIYTTHSSEIVARANSNSIYSLSRSAGEVKIEKINTENIEQVRQMLHNLGVSLTDVMGSDEVVWVEGATEAEAFPKLLIASGVRRIPVFMAIKNTGDFQKKKSNIALIFDIYRKMSNTTKILPTKVRFAFDREGLTAAQIQDLTRESCGNAYFTDRRMFENYILHAESIHRVISNELNHKNVPDLKEVEGRIQESQNEYGATWETEVDAAKLLADLFQKTVGACLLFDKPRHPVLILEDIIEHDPAYLDPLKTYIRRLCQ